MKPPFKLVFIQLLLLFILPLATSCHAGQPTANAPENTIAAAPASREAGSTTAAVQQEGSKKKESGILHRKNKKETQPVEAIIETSKGTMRAILYTEDAPITTKNFIKLAESGFYTGLKFHRVEPGFVVQTGDPTGTGMGGSDETIPLEVKPNLKHDSAGVLAMARTNDPNSASSQFYITLAPAKFLDGNYAVFGKVVEGVDVAQEIRVGDTLEKVSIKQPAKAE